MRTFLSVTPPCEVRREIEIVQRLLAEAVQAERLRRSLLVWSLPEKMHLTLRFLGETRTGQRAQVEASLREIAERTVGFPVTLQGVGVFPSWRKPGVVWLGFAASPALLTLQAAAEAAAQDAGFAAEGRAYTPHLTLAYVHKHASADEARQLGEVLRETVQREEIAKWQQTFLVTRIELMQSELLPSGARYSVLASELLR